jgi:hypothetical protein
MQSTLHFLLVLWLNFIFVPLPPRVVGTYAELLVGAMISGSGHITDALLAVGHQKHFSTYYWLIEKAKWSYLAVSRQLARLIVRCFPRREWNLVIDDFICPRNSKEAPEVKYHKEHSTKPNRPKYIWGQQWVLLGLSVTWGKLSACLPLLPRLHKNVGNGTKLTTALSLVRAVRSLFGENGGKLRCLVDAWYMKGKFVLRLLKWGIDVIGQVRKDTALFLEPDPVPEHERKKGRPRKYGAKLTPERVQKLKLHKARLNIYGGVKEVKYRTTKCLARFLLGCPVIAVWCQLPDQKGWSLILCTDLSLSPEQIIKLYARRWKIEPMFNEIKHGYGVAEAWERTSRNLHRWVSMLCVAYSLTRMLSLVGAARKHRKTMPLIQWRKNHPVTAGLVKMALVLFFRQFSFSRLWNPKSKKFTLPDRHVGEH